MTGRVGFKAKFLVPEVEEILLPSEWKPVAWGVSKTKTKGCLQAFLMEYEERRERAVRLLSPLQLVLRKHPGGSGGGAVSPAYWRLR